MFGKPGVAYVYFSYGVHHCLNVTAERVGIAGAVLLRALEPVDGIELMQQTGVNGPVQRLLSGPGKICKAFGLSLEDNGRDLVEGPLWIASGREVPDVEVSVSPRIGISRAVTLPYRFFVTGSPSVSGSRKALKAG
jgi:DNA-3-methyladenine glycosylase